MKFINFIPQMKSETIISFPKAKGAAIFKKILDDKKAISEHIRKGGKISEIKDKYNFVVPLPFKEIR